jgi:hypothetical protein
MTVYQPRLVNQLDGSRFAGYNCTMASGATAIDRHTLGHIRTTGARMRYLSGDTSGGTNLNQLDYAWHRGWGQDFDVRLRMPWNDAVSYIKAGRGAVLQLHYGTLGKYRFQLNFYGNHAIYINEIGTMRNSVGTLIPAGKMFDPLGKVTRWVPLSTLKTAAAQLVLGSGRVCGTGYCYIGFTKRIGLTTGATSPTPAIGSVPTLILAKPPTPSEVNPMIPGSGLTRTSSHVMSLKSGQPFYRTPAGPVIARLPRDMVVEYFGTAGTGWRCVEILTKAAYADGVARNTLVYVPAAAGPVTKKA